MRQTDCMLLETMQLHKMDLVSEDQRDAVFKKQVTEQHLPETAQLFESEGRENGRDFLQPFSLSFARSLFIEGLTHSSRSRMRSAKLQEA